MTATSVVGGSPLFVLTDQGLQVGIPLTALSIKNGAVDTSRIAPAIAAGVGKMANALLASHFLSPGAEPAPVLALTLKAAIPGDAGNSIGVTFANIVPDDADPGKTKLDATVTAKDRRTGLTATTIGDELGTPAGGSQPGLVVLTGAAVKLPKATAPAKLAAANPGDPLQLAVAAEDGSGDAFSFQAAGSQDLYKDVTVAIEDVDTGAGTFTLAVVLDHSETGVALKNLGAKLGAVVDVAPGPDGYAVPAEGSWKLAGGSAAHSVPPTSAQANILSN